MVIAGVMSGSSLDGLDIAIVEFGNDDAWSIIGTYDQNYSEEWVLRLRTYTELSAPEYIKLVADYSYYIGSTLASLLETLEVNIDCISFHGHTLVHLPEKGITEQIGNGGIIAALTGLDTCTDFRTMDVAKGGVGTPLAPIVEQSLFGGYNYYLNLGGIANITHVKINANPIAYDVCACNQVLNHFSNMMGLEYDKDGQLAREGQLNTDVQNYLKTDVYTKLPSPKSLDNNWIVDKFIPNFPAAETKHILHTYCHWMAGCIANEVVESSIKSTLMVSGGGAHNSFFIECLREELLLKNCELIVPENDIIDFKEAILMALMAQKYITNDINVLSNVTGATSDSIGGAMYKAF